MSWNLTGHEDFSCRAGVRGRQSGQSLIIPNTVRYLAEMFYGNALTPSVMMRGVMMRGVMVRGVMTRGDVGSRMSACQVVQVVMDYGD